MSQRGEEEEERRRERREEEERREEREEERGGEERRKRGAWRGERMGKGEEMRRGGRVKLCCDWALGSERFTPAEFRPQNPSTGDSDYGPLIAHYTV